MRFATALSAAIALLLNATIFSAVSARAEKRIFIIANDDGYGVDNCLTSGGPCGAAVANSYCRAREFAQAIAFRKVDRDDITGAIPTSDSNSCHGGACDNFVAIECSR